MRNATKPKLVRDATRDKLEAILTLDALSLNFRVELTPEQFVQLAPLLPKYNEMDEWTFGDLARFIDERAPRMRFGEGNPNNGRHFVEVLVGNESSRVVYVRMRGAYMGAPRQAELDDFIGVLELRARQAGAQEFTVERENDVGTTTARIWWD